MKWNPTTPLAFPGVCCYSPTQETPARGFKNPKFRQEIARKQRYPTNDNPLDSASLRSGQATDLLSPMSNPLIATRDYFRHSMAELKKVTWPSRDLTVRYSLLVVGICVAMGAFFAVLDLGLQQGVNVLFSHSAATNAPVAPPVTPDVVPAEGQAPGIEVTTEPEVLNAEPASGDTPITLPPINVSGQ